MKIEKILISLLIFLLVEFSITAQPLQFEWGIATDSSSIGMAIGRDITVNSAGEVISTGIYYGTVDFDPSINNYNLTANAISPAYDVYIQKLDANNNFLWAKSIGNSTYTASYSIDVDSLGNIYVVGISKGVIDMDPGPGTDIFYGAPSASTIFVLKLDPNGNYVWSKMMEGSSSQTVNSVHIDKKQNILLTGGFSTTVDFDPGIAVFNLSSPQNKDVYVLKLDNNGSFLWAGSFSGTGDLEGFSITSDNSNNMLITGKWKNTVDFDPGVGTTYLSEFSPGSCFITKLDEAGNLIWVKTIGGSPGTDQGKGIVTDANNNVITVGQFYDTIDFDPNSGVQNLTSVGSADAFISKLDSNGNYIWAKSVGGVTSDNAINVEIDQQNNLYIAGEFTTTADFDPGAGTFNITAGSSIASEKNTFIMKLDFMGSFDWAQSIYCERRNYHGGINYTKTNNLLITGHFWGGKCDLNPDPIDTLFKYNYNSYSTYIVKLSECINSQNTISPTACSSYVSPSGNYSWTTSNTYLDTIPNAGGCDSIITINLTITGPSNGTDLQTACGSYLWIDNNTYTSSNTTATHTITNGAANGCDSIVTLNLTINNATTSTDAQTACGSYTWIDNNTYTSSNTIATHTLVGGNSVGCDSVLTLNLTINNADTSVTQVSPTLTANATGATYQWLDCDNAFAVIAGETSQNYTATANGNYAVQVTENGCTDTSSCYSIVGIGIEESSFGSSFKIYPNPTNGNVSIVLEKVYAAIAIKVMDITGKVIDQKKYKTTNRIDYNFNGANGIYFIELSSENKEKTTFKIIKQ